MKIKERWQPQAAEIYPGGPGQFLLSAPPIFDVDKARGARSLVEKEELDDFPALQVALALSIYNMETVGFGQNTQFSRRLEKLIGEEIKASSKTNPLPTIGIEVESPRKPFDRFRDSPDYAEFFDAVGMPRNRVNSLSNYKSRAKSETWPNFWEFSPPPSYTAAVQSRILCELVKGGFVPSLRFSKDPGNIKEYLDNKLVSLHVNLGSLPLNWFVHKEDSEVFGAAFAFAFTSAQRLASRQNREFVHFPAATPTLKSEGADDKRLEIKALEVGSENTYRLMREIQLLGAALFAFMGNTNQELADKWSQAKEEIMEVFRAFYITPKIIEYDKSMAAQLREEGNIGRLFRWLITAKALEISRIIDESR